VIDELVVDPPARRRFLEQCSLDGLLLALSHAGGRTGERSLPLVVDDADWDVVGGCIHELVPELADEDVLRLLASLEAATAAADARTAAELRALVVTALARLASCWRARAWPDVELLGRWLDLAATLPEPPAELEVERVWELLVPAAVTPLTTREAERYLAWLRLANILWRRVPEQLQELGFPDACEPQLDALLALNPIGPAVKENGSLRAALHECLGLVQALVPKEAGSAARLRLLLGVHEARLAEAMRDDPVAHPRVPDPPRQWALVRRILADLG
jgi:hypothetical protein